MTTSKLPPWSLIRIATWAIVAVLVSVWFGPGFISSFRPRDGMFMDFVQEWLSAKNIRAGIPVYAPQAETFPLHTGVVPERSEDLLLWNAHPPVAVLLCLPCAWIDYPSAHLIWNIISLVLFGLSLALVVRELGVPFRLLSVLPLVALCLLNHPLQNHIVQGQLNTLLSFLIALAWLADRRGASGWAGAFLGFAAAIKLFPAFLFLYFLCTRRWKAILTGGAVFVALNAATAGALGPDTYRDYVRVVIPSVAQRYQTNWANVSLAGFWLRVFDPDPKYAVPLVHAPLFGTLFANGSRLLVLIATARACWFATTREQRDRAFGIALTAMVLVSPIGWNHYYLLLLIPLGLLWMHLKPGRERWLMRAVLVVMWVAEWGPMLFVLDLSRLAAITQGTGPMTPVENLLAVSVPHYALLGFFLLTFLVRVPPSGENG